MSSFTKKILSAFMEVSDDHETKNSPAENIADALPAVSRNLPPVTGTDKFNEHFEKLFAEANLPGPDYYEFAKMTEAMNGISDEKARYCAAFAGLQVQGVDKEKLLSSAQDYLQLLDKDAASFLDTVSATVNNKVVVKKQEIEEAKQQMQSLSQQILDLQQKITALTKDVEESTVKIESNRNGYSARAESVKSKLLSDIEKINQHIL